jgi:hypothetical protein
MVRGPHPDQSSDALGTAGAMPGPRAMGLAAWLHHAFVVSADKVARLCSEVRLSATASRITQAPCGSPTTRQAPTTPF